jgi:hypothetical protein
MGSIVNTHNVSHARSGTPWTDTGPRTPVTVTSLADTCWHCVWVTYRREDGAWAWYLKSVHGSCTEHYELRKP